MSAMSKIAFKFGSTSEGSRAFCSPCEREHWLDGSGVVRGLVQTLLMTDIERAPIEDSPQYGRAANLLTRRDLQL